MKLKKVTVDISEIIDQETGIVYSLHRVSILRFCCSPTIVETNFSSLLYYLDKFERYISNLFLGIVYQLRDQ